MGRLAEAEQEYQRAIAILEKLLVESPSVPEFQRRLTISNTKLAALLQAADRPVEAEQEYRRAVALAEKLADPQAQHELGPWSLATDPSPGLRDPQLALGLAKKAVEQAPQVGSYWKTLGLARYRAGDGSCHRVLWRSPCSSCAGGDAAVWFFLAMAHWQLGEKNQARRWYDRAVDTCERNQSQDNELRRFRAEAATQLGITDAAKSTGKKEDYNTRQSKP